jgi:hypothetical protein
MDEEQQKFNDPVHNEDSYVVQQHGIIIYIMGESGVPFRAYLTNDAIKQLSTEVDSI